MNQFSKSKFNFYNLYMKSELSYFSSFFNHAENVHEKYPGLGRKTAGSFFQYLLELIADRLFFRRINFFSLLAKNSAIWNLFPLPLFLFFLITSYTNLYVCPLLTPLPFQFGCLDQQPLRHEWIFDILQEFWFFFTEVFNSCQGQQKRTVFQQLKAAWIW